MDMDSDIETNAIDNIEPAELETAKRARNAQNTRNALDTIGITTREREALDSTLES